jgi:hypothetical protein
MAFDQLRSGDDNSLISDPSIDGSGVIEDITERRG